MVLRIVLEKSLLCYLAVKVARIELFRSNHTGEWLVGRWNKAKQGQVEEFESTAFSQLCK